MKPSEVIAIGTCYVDTNLPSYPFASTGIPADAELIGDHYEIVAGGSAVNFCRMLGEFGLKTAFIGMAGPDANGDSLETALLADGVKPSLIRNESVLTNISFNMTNGEGEHIMLVAGTANAELNGEGVLPILRETLHDTDMVYLGGCFKLKKLSSSFEEIANLVKENNKSLIVDHGRVPQALDDETRDAVKKLVRGSHYYLPSKNEFCELWGVGTIEKGLQKLQTEAPSLTIVVKDGANGAWYCDAGKIQHAPAQIVEKVINATGAGDSFNAGFMSAISKNVSLPKAINYACLVGAAKVANQPIPHL